MKTVGSIQKHQREQARRFCTEVLLDHPIDSSGGEGDDGQTMFYQLEDTRHRPDSELERQRTEKSQRLRWHDAQSRAISCLQAVIDQTVNIVERETLVRILAYTQACDARGELGILCTVGIERVTCDNHRVLVDDVRVGRYLGQGRKRTTLPNDPTGRIRLVTKHNWAVSDSLMDFLRAMPETTIQWKRALQNTIYQRIKRAMQTLHAHGLILEEAI